MEAGNVITIVIAVGEFVALCFLAPVASRVGKLEDLLHSMDKKLMTSEEINEKIDLKIYSHMTKCHAYNSCKSTQKETKENE